MGVGTRATAQGSTQPKDYGVYQPEFTDGPHDLDGFWAKVRMNFEFARDVLEGLHVESAEEALAGTYRRDNCARLLGQVAMIAHSGTSEENDQLDYFLRLGRQAIPIVAVGLEERVLSAEFLHWWGVLQFCHGYVASHAFLDKDVFASQRGAVDYAKTVSVDEQRVWVAKILTAASQAGKSRKAANRTVEFLAQTFIARGGHGPQHPAEWFKKILRGDNSLKATYLTKKFILTDVKQYAAEEIPGLPPTSL